MDLLLSSSSSSIRGILQDRLEGMTPRAADAVSSSAILHRPATAIIIVSITIVAVAVSILLLRRRKGRPIPDQKGA